MSTVELRERLTERAIAGPRRLGVAGIVIGILAGWLSLPPATVRTPAVPIVLGAIAIAIGAYAAAREQRRVGYGAVAAGLIGLGLGLLLQHSSTSHLEAAFAWGTLLAATLRYATPLTFAALGACSPSGAAS